MSHTTAELSEINSKLKAMIADEDAQIRLVVQTGYDETGMVATADGYLRLAQVLIEFVLSAKGRGSPNLGHIRSLPIRFNGNKRSIPGKL